MLIAAMSAPCQNILWFTDQDAIAPNTRRLQDATAVIARYLSNLCRHRLGHIRFGTTQCDDGSLQIEDLAALPDLAAGTIAEFFSQVRVNNTVAASPLILSAPKTLPEKAKMVAGWLGDHPQSRHPLRKVVVLVDDRGGKTHKTSVVRFTTDQPLPEFDWQPEVDAYLANKLVIPPTAAHYGEKGEKEEGKSG